MKVIQRYFNKQPIRMAFKKGLLIRVSDVLKASGYTKMSSLTRRIPKVNHIIINDEAYVSVSDLFDLDKHKKLKGSLRDFITWVAKSTVDAIKDLKSETVMVAAWPYPSSSVQNDCPSTPERVEARMESEAEVIIKQHFLEYKEKNTAWANNPIYKINELELIRKIKGIIAQVKLKAS